MSEWQPIETLHHDGRQILLHSPLGGCFVSRAIPPGPYPSRRETVEMVRAGGALPHQGWNPTHYMECPAPPLPVQETKE